MGGVLRGGRHGVGASRANLNRGRAGRTFDNEIR